MHRRIHRGVALACGAVALSGSAGRASAQSLTWGSMVTDTGPDVFDWELAGWIDEFFEDGSKNDGTVDSNILLLFTECYGGDFLENFNGPTGEAAGGAGFDNVSFSNTTRMSAQEAGKTASYGGYHDDAASALKPGATANDVHQAGVNGKFTGYIFNRDLTENPQFGGPAFKTVGGTTSTHLLVWAGDPNDQDRTDINTVVGNFTSHPNTTMTVLAGDGTTADGTSHVDGPATKDNLRTTLQNIGSMMDDGADEQFVLFVTDHGNIEKSNTTASTLPPATITSSTHEPGELTASIELTDNELNDIQDDPENIPTLNLFTELEGIPDPLIEPVEFSIGVDIEHHFLGSLGLADKQTIQFPDGSTKIWYSLTISPESILLPQDSPDGLRLGDANPGFLSLSVNMLNYSPFPLAFDKIMIGSGNISKLTPIPEPAPLTLLSLGGGLRLLRRRHIQ